MADLASVARLRRGQQPNRLFDVDVVVKDAADVPPVTERLTALGYVAQGDLAVPGREAFAPPIDEPYHHLCVVLDPDIPQR